MEGGTILISDPIRQVVTIESGDVKVQYDGCSILIYGPDEIEHTHSKIDLCEWRLMNRIIEIMEEE